MNRTRNLKPTQKAKRANDHNADVLLKEKEFTSVCRKVLKGRKNVRNKPRNRNNTTHKKKCIKKDAKCETVEKCDKKTNINIDDEGINKRMKIAPTDYKYQVESYCFLCKELVTQEKGISVMSNNRLPLSGLTVVSLLHCFNISLPMYETVHSKERFLACRQCYKLVIKGDSAYNYVYSVALKMNRQWCDVSSKSLSFSLNFSNSEKDEESSDFCFDTNISTIKSSDSGESIIQNSVRNAWQCRYCDQEFCSKKDLNFHLTSVHKLLSDNVKVKSPEICKNTYSQNSLPKSDENIKIKEDILDTTLMRDELNKGLLASEKQLTGLPKHKNIFHKSQLETEPSPSVLDLKTGQKSNENYQQTTRFLSLNALKAKQELLLQEKEDNVILSYLMDSIDKNQEQCKDLSIRSNLSCSRNIRTCANATDHSQQIAENKACQLNIKEKIKNPEIGICHISDKGKSETILRKHIKKEKIPSESNTFICKIRPKIIATEKSPHDIVKKENDFHKPYPKLKYEKHKQKQFAEGGSVYNNDASCAENTQSKEDIDILGGEGGCAVVDIYDGPVNLSDASDDFRCIIISE